MHQWSMMAFAQTHVFVSLLTACFFIIIILVYIVKQPFKAIHEDSKYSYGLWP